MLNRVLGLFIATLGLATATVGHAASGSVALERVRLHTLCIHPGQIELPSPK